MLYSHNECKNVIAIILYTGFYEANPSPQAALIVSILVSKLLDLVNVYWSGSGLVSAGMKTVNSF